MKIGKSSKNQLGNALNGTMYRSVLRRDLYWNDICKGEKLYIQIAEAIRPDIRSTITSYLSRTYDQK